MIGLDYLSLLMSTLTVVFVLFNPLEYWFKFWKRLYGFLNAYHLWLDKQVVENRRKFIMTILIWPKMEKRKILTVYSFPLDTANLSLHWVRNKKEKMSLQRKYLMQSICHRIHSKIKTLKWVLNFFSEKWNTVRII